MTREWEAVEVRRRATDVVITPPGFPTARLQQSALPVVGGTVFVDVERPDRPPRAVLSDPDAAQGWLAGVYGDAVAGTVVAFVDPTHDAVVQETAVRDRLSATTGRLGLGFWLHRWWPSGAPDVPEIDGRLLELEIGALAWVADALWVDSAPTAVLLAPHVELLVEHVESLRAHGVGATGAGELGILTTAMHACLDLVDPGAPGMRELMRLVDAMDADERVVLDALADTDWTTMQSTAWDDVLARLTAPAPATTSRGPRRGGAAARGAILHQGAGTVDQAQVPPRTVLARRRTVQWLVVEDDDGVTVEVRVRAARALHGDVPPLHARIFAGGPPYLVQLDFVPELRSFVGSRALPATPTVEPRADAFDPAYAQRPQVDPAGQAGVERALDLVRAFIRGRAAVSLDVTAHFLGERQAWALHG